MHCDILQPPEPPLSPPAALPSSILHLPIDLDARSLPLTHSPSERPSHLDDVQSLFEPSHSAQDGDAFFHRPSPLPAENWLDVGPTSLTERDHFEWEDGIKPPQPLCHEPLRSVWSPESPPPIEELDEMDFDPSAPSFSRSSTVSSLWSLESLPDERESDPSPRWTDADGSWTTSPDHQDGDLLHLPPIPPSFSYPGYDYKAPSNNHWDDRGCLSPTGFSQEDGEELLRSPSSPRSPLVNIPDSPLHDDDDDDYDTSALLSTPNRRKSLPELEDDYGHMSPSSGILNLPGPGTDDTVMDFDQELPEIDLTSPPLTTCPTPPELFDGPALGLYVADEFSNAAQSPSPEYTHVDDFFTYFPELEKYEIPNTDDTAEGLDPLHPDYDLVRLIGLCRRSRDAEKTARAREIKIGEKVKAITANMCPPDGVDTIERRIALHQEYTRKMEQTKIRKREKERCRELRSLLRIKLESMEREKEMLRSQDQILDQEDGPSQIQEETMDVEGATKATLGVEGPNKKWMSNDMGQLVAKMLFSRRDVYKPLGTRKVPCQGSSTYMRSPLACPKDDNVVDPDAVLVGDVDVVPMDIEEPPISN